jgi:hypothetical protein
MWMVAFGLAWALLALVVALGLGRTIRRADEQATKGTWQSFCVSHDLEHPAWQDHQVGA